MTRSELINLIIKNRGYKKYLEIGVNTPAQPGYNWDNAKIELKHGVDPNVDTTFKMTSDEFFAEHIDIKYDLVFVDGLHIFEQAHRDIINSLKWLKEGGAIVVHDCNPVEEITQRRKRASDVWHGDVWKAILKLRIESPDVKIYTVDTDEGCTIIQKGKQKLFKVGSSEDDIYNYEFFDANRDSILNLTSVEEFRGMINSHIIIRLMGGLGNQMFQYSLGRNLALSNNITVKLDLSWFAKQKKRKYRLDLFNVVENFATNKEVKDCTQNNSRLASLRRLFKPNSCAYIKQEQFNSDPAILKIKSSTYLDGYWQSEKYFKNIKDIIYKEFTLKNNEEISSDKFKQDILNSNSVSLHIRRSDYITEASSTYWTCSLNYYYQAIDKITREHKNIKIFVFSDDIEWAKKNIKTKHQIAFVEGNKDYEDLILMSKCQHNIIANSSFSWWGAWLNSNQNKIVIAPKKWFNDLSISDEDLIPGSWIKM